VILDQQFIVHLYAPAEGPDAEAAYRANGFYQPADLDKLSSGNSAAHTANALYIASGVLLASAAALTFAF